VIRHSFQRCIFPPLPLPTAGTWGMRPLQRMHLSRPFLSTPIRSGRTGPQGHQPRDRPRHLACPLPFFLENSRKSTPPPGGQDGPFSPLALAIGRAGERESESRAMPRDLCRRGPCGLKKKKKNWVWQPAFIASCAYTQVSDVLELSRFRWIG
jgi:hypothetical protein